jgi:hypothetical protein
MASFWMPNGGGSVIVDGDGNPILCDDCPCDEPVHCGRCSTLQADEYQIEISGVANQDCTDCASFNGTFIVTDFVPAVGGLDCIWRYTPAGVLLCGLYPVTLVLEMNFFGTPLEVRWTYWPSGTVDDGTPSRFLSWYTLANPIDCANLNEFSTLTQDDGTFFTGDFNRCATSGATCKVTAL